MESTKSKTTKEEPSESPSPAKLSSENPPKARMEVSDEEGNILFARNGELFLLLKGENRERFIGTWVESEKTIYVKRRFGSQTHNKIGGIGFNYMLVHESKKAEFFIVELDDGRKLKTDRQTIIQWGRVKQFSKEGKHYDVQIFLPFQHFEVL